MGSLYQKPKTSAVAVVSPPAASTAATTPTTAAATTTETAASEDAQKAAGIVKKNRSLPATVLTSFRGVLDTGDWVPVRKSLLGE